MKSESIANLAKALSQAQEEVPAVTFDATNEFLHNRYASLGAVIEVLRPVLKKNGLSYSLFINGLSRAAIEVDRKMLADIAARDAAGFAELAAKVKASLAG